MYITQISYTIFLTTQISRDFKSKFTTERLDAFAESAAKRL